jgi:hypothetical protein
LHNFIADLLLSKFALKYFPKRLTSGLYEFGVISYPAPPAPFLALPSLLKENKEKRLQEETPNPSEAFTLDPSGKPNS